MADGFAPKRYEQDATMIVYR